MSSREEIREGVAFIISRRRSGNADTSQDHTGIKADELLRYLHSEGVVVKVDRDKDNKYPLVEFYTSKMPRAVDNPEVECGFYEPIVVESLM